MPKTKLVFEKDENFEKDYFSFSILSNFDIIKRIESNFQGSSYIIKNKNSDEGKFSLLKASIIENKDELNFHLTCGNIFPKYFGKMESYQVIQDLINPSSSFTFLRIFSFSSGEKLQDFTFQKNSERESLRELYSLLLQIFDSLHILHKNNYVINSLDIYSSKTSEKKVKLEYNGKSIPTFGMTYYFFDFSRIERTDSSKKFREDNFRILEIFLPEKRKYFQSSRDDILKSEIDFMNYLLKGM